MVQSEWPPATVNKIQINHGAWAIQNDKIGEHSFLKMYGYQYKYQDLNKDRNQKLANSKWQKQNQSEMI